MEQFDWREFLNRWSRELLACPRVTAGLPPNVIASGWLGHPGATEEDIRAAEVRLGVELPPSYRAFLRYSNGWGTTGSDAGRLFSIGEIHWYHMRHQDAIDDWLEGERLGGGPTPVPDEEYFVYGDLQQPHTARLEYLQTALQVSEMVESCVYLLNPRVVTREGEWEAWYLAPWMPGAWRFRSFWDLMEGEYNYFEC